MCTHPPAPRPRPGPRQPAACGRACASLAVTTVHAASRRPASPTATTTRPARPPAPAGSGRQINRPHLILWSGSFGDYGLTADLVLALDSATSVRPPPARSTRALTRHVLDYTGGGGPEGVLRRVVREAAQRRRRAAHPTRATSALGAAPQPRRQPARLERGTAGRCPGADRGRFSDLSAFGDFSNTITQSLALLGLERTTGQGPSSASVVYLRRQQCANGAFR